MAYCEFADGLKNVRGTISKRTWYEKGLRVTERVVAKVTATGKQRVYVHTYRQRTTEPTEKELANRAKMAEATRRLNALSPEQMDAYREVYERENACFKGKKYNTLRGFIVAHIYSAL